MNGLRVEEGQQDMMMRCGLDTGEKKGSILDEMTSSTLFIRGETDGRATECERAR
jgi:hypothetical protein